MRVEFEKMEGAGNDFILIDNRDNAVPDVMKKDMAVRCCHRRFGIGADGLVFVEEDPEFDFAWDFYNPDGSVAEMCGNGARCVSRFANRIGAAGDSMVFRSLAGPIRAHLTERGAKVQLTDAVLPKSAETVAVDDASISLWRLNTGVPHAVVQVTDLDGVEVKKLGAALRHHEHFAPAGTNVNFFTIGPDGRICIRTYERGVEGETLACGTGSVATGIVSVLFFGATSPVTMVMRGGGELVIHFTLTGDKAESVFLEGPANRVFVGTIEF